MKITVKGTKMTIELDLDNTPELSSTGKTRFAAKTPGYLPLNLIAADLPEGLKKAKMNLMLTVPATQETLGL